MRFAPILFYCATLLAAPPKSIPTQYLDAFTLGGEIAVESFYRDDSYPPEHPLIDERLPSARIYPSKVMRELQTTNA